jgi:hypothetical protein
VNMFFDEPLHAIELNFDSPADVSEGKLGETHVIWKDILPEGRFPLMPGVGGRKIPFEVVPTGESSLSDRRISMSDLIASYDQRAFPSGVTIPDGHPKVTPDGNLEDSALNNTGYVNGLRVVKKNDKHVLQAALAFTEPDVAGKVKRGSVPNVSSGVLFNWVRKSDARKFPAALNHVALTKVPWIDGLEPFKRVFASDEISEAVVVQFDDEEPSVEKETGAEVIWNEVDGSNWLRTAVNTALNPPQDPALDGMPQMTKPFYDVNDVAATKKLALVTEFYKGDTKQWVIPFDIADDKVNVAPSTRWVEGQQALIAASDKPIDDLRPEKIVDRLQVALDQMQHGEGFKVEALTFDHRCQIRNIATGQGYAALFSLVGDAVYLHDASHWTRTDVVPPEGTPQEQQRPVYASDKITPLFDESTPEGRVNAARQRRRALLAGRSNL